MTELWPITIFSCLMAITSHGYSQIDLTRGIYARKEKLLYCVMAVAMVLFCGLRKGYNDTYTYVQMYNALSVGEGLTWSGIDWQIGSNPGFWVVNLLLTRAGASSQTFLMFYAALSVGVYLWFIRKYTENIWLSVFFMFTMGVYTFTFAAIKQCVAVAFCLIATDRVFQKKWIQFSFYIYRNNVSSVFVYVFGCAVFDIYAMEQKNVYNAVSFCCCRISFAALTRYGSKCHFHVGRGVRCTVPFRRGREPFPFSGLLNADDFIIYSQTADCTERR